MRSLAVLQVKRPAVETPAKNLAAPEQQLAAARDRLTPRVVARLGELRGWTAPAIDRLQLGWDGDRVVFPVLDETGCPVGCSGYQPDPSQRAGKPKMLAAPGTPRGLFPPPELIGNDEGDRVVWLLEGEPDVVRAWSVGLVAVGVPGAQNWKTEWAPRFTRRRVIVCFDGDNPGREGARGAADDLARAGIDVRIVDLHPGDDQGADLTDFLKSAGTDPELATQACRLLHEIAESSPSPPPPASLPSLPAASTIDDGWEPYDIVEHKDDLRETPDIAGLVYPGRRTLISGPKEAHKTWLVACAAATELQASRGVIWIDLDDMGPRATYERLHALGVGDAIIQALFYYVRPSSRLGSREAARLVAWGVDHDSRLCVVDSFTGLLRLHGLKQNEGVDVDQAWSLFDPLARAGIAPTILDHVVKDKDGRGDMAIGSERKDSAAWAHLSLRPGTRLARGGKGDSLLVVSKDRGAYFPRPNAGRIDLDSDDDGNVSWSIAPAAADDDHHGDWRPTGYMEKVSRFIENFQGTPSKNEVESGGLGQAGYVRKAIIALVDDCYLELAAGKHGSHLLRSLVPYREADDPLR